MCPRASALGDFSAKVKPSMRFDNNRVNNAPTHFTTRQKCTESCISIASFGPTRAGDAKDSQIRRELGRLSDSDSSFSSSLVELH